MAAFLPEIVRPLYAWMATASGYGFPSDHAVASTIVWGGLAWAVRVGRGRARVAVAAGLAALVSARESCWPSIAPSTSPSARSSAWPSV